MSPGPDDLQLPVSRRSAQRLVPYSGNRSLRAQSIREGFDGRLELRRSAVPISTNIPLFPEVTYNVFPSGQFA